MGVDRHLMCLKLITAEELPREKLHPMFAHPLIAKGSDYQLSTSQLPWSVPDHPGFGAPTQNAIGCCYRFAPKSVVATVATRRSSNGKDAARFAKLVLDVLRVLREGGAVELASPSKAKL